MNLRVGRNNLIKKKHSNHQLEPWLINIYLKYRLEIIWRTTKTIGPQNRFKFSHYWPTHFHQPTSSDSFPVSMIKFELTVTESPTFSMKSSITCNLKFIRRFSCDCTIFLV